MTCQSGHPECGHPRTKHGPPPKGWVHVKVVRGQGAWYCSPECAWAGMTTTPSPPRPAPPIPASGPRHDVANCPLCINRHDRAHRCAICNTAPQIVRPAPAPVRLYHHAEERTA